MNCFRRWWPVKLGYGSLLPLPRFRRATDTDTRRKRLRHRVGRWVLGRMRPSDQRLKNDTARKRRSGGDTAVGRWNGKIEIENETKNKRGKRRRTRKVCGWGRSREKTKKHFLPVLWNTAAWRRWKTVAWRNTCSSLRKEEYEKLFFNYLFIYL